MRLEGSRDRAKPPVEENNVNCLLVRHRNLRSPKPPVIRGEILGLEVLLGLAGLDSDVWS